MAVFTNSTFLSRNGNCVSYQKLGDTIAGTTKQGTGDVTFCNLGGFGAFRRITIFLEHEAASGTSAFTMHWFGAVLIGDPIPFAQTFWTGMTAPTDAGATDTDSYFFQADSLKSASSGTADEAPGMLSTPYLGIGIDNTGARQITFDLIVSAELI